jgi:hypothetical protein
MPTPTSPPVGYAKEASGNELPYDHFPGLCRRVGVKKQSSRLTPACLARCFLEWRDYADAPMPLPSGSRQNEAAKRKLRLSNRLWVQSMSTVFALRARPRSGCQPRKADILIRCNGALFWVLQGRSGELASSGGRIMEMPDLHPLFRLASSYDSKKKRRCRIPLKSFGR